MTDQMSFNCPHCKVGLQAPFDAIGRDVTCNKCGKRFIVPAQFEFDAPEPAKAAPRPATGAVAKSGSKSGSNSNSGSKSGNKPGAPAPARPATGPVFTKPEPKAKVQPSSAQKMTQQVTQIASLVALPLIAAVVLGGGAWWFFSGDEAASETTAVTSEQSSGDTKAKADAEAAAAAEVTRLKTEQERRDQESVDKKYREALVKVSQEINQTKPGTTPAAAPGTATPATTSATATAATKADATKTGAVKTPADAAAATPEAPRGKSSIADLVELYGPSVVVVKTNTGNGAGFVAFAPDLIVTNHHVVSGARSFQAIFMDGKRTVTHNVTVVAIDSDNDLALLKLSQPSTAKVLEFADSSAVRSGSEVFAIGNPGMGGTILSQTVSNGIISNTDRVLGKRKFFQTNTAINPGNSGGPLFDLEGKVVGVVTAKATRQENIGFAVPGSLVLDFYKERDGKYRVEGDFVKWEGKQPFERLRRHAGAIALNTYPTDMVLDAERDQLVAISPETNKVIFVDLKERKVVREVFTGTDPISLQFGAKGEIWVANRTSKNLVALDLVSGKINKTLSLTHEPLAFTVGRNSIWFMDSTGQAIVVKTTGKDESEADLFIRSLAIYGAGGDILCGSAKSWLCEFDPDKVQTVISRRRSQKKAIDDFNADARSGSSKASEARREALLKDLADTEKILDKAIKVYNQPAGTDVDFSQKQQSLFVDEPRKRIYFNRCVMDLKDPGKIIGVFKSPEHSLQNSEEIKAFLQKYPYLNQIRAVSPDGSVAASGTHLYNTADFTIIGELPVPTTSIVFHTDNKTLYLGDSINRQVVGIDYRQKEEAGE